MRLIDADACEPYFYDHLDDTGMAGALNAIAEMPTIFVAEHRWIPVNERLPNGQTEVIVSCTDDAGDTRYRYTASGWVTTDGEYWIVDNEINPFVTAWMPLPPPWKGVNDE